MRSLSLRRPSASMIVASVALFAALGGSSYAAAKITGKEIANHTVRGVDVHKRTLSAKHMKLDSLGGDQIDESALGIVPNADTLDGIDSAGYMKTGQRLFEATVDGADNFTPGAPLVELANVPAGSYLVTAKLTYDDDTGAVTSATCTLEVPGANDTTEFYTDNTEVVSLQKAVTSGAAFNANVNCTGNGDDDMVGKGSIIATKVD
jgi:hypothetical protein